MCRVSSVQTISLRKYQPEGRNNLVPRVHEPKMRKHRFKLPVLQVIGSKFVAWDSTVTWLDRS